MDDIGIDTPTAVDAAPRNVAAPEQASVAILLCTLQGEKFLAEQLDSIARQTHTRWTVWASDDGSTDATHAILARYAVVWGDHRIAGLAGPGQGFVRNFLSLACNPDIEAEYFAYADQDDVWKPGKLARAVAWLETVPEGVPALYCSRTCLIDAAGREFGFSPRFTKPPGFANALVQSIGGANTIVFNHAARRLLQLAGSEVTVPSHDWWTYLLVAGCGGRIWYDRYPSVRYRQHGANLVGSNVGWRARLSRVGRMMQGQLRRWNGANLRALRRMRPHLTPENRRILDEFRAVRSPSLPARLIAIWRSGVHRQGRAENAMLLAAAVMNKL